MHIYLRQLFACNAITRSLSWSLTAQKPSFTLANAQLSLIFFTLFPSLCCYCFFLSLYPSLLFLLSIRKKKKLTGRSRLHVSSWDKSVKKRCHFKWMLADRRRHNAAFFYSPPLFAAAISAYRPPFLSTVDYRSFHKCINRTSS